MSPIVSNATVHAIPSRPDAPTRSRPMNAAAPHRATLTVLVALAAAAVVAGAHRRARRRSNASCCACPRCPRPRIALGFAAVGLLVVRRVGASRSSSRAVRTRARRAALAATVRGELSCGIRSRLLVQRLNEVANADRPVRLGARYSIVVDELGVAFWNGGQPAPPRGAVPVARGAQHPRRLDGGRRRGRSRGRAARAAQRRERRAADHPRRRGAPCGSRWPTRRSSRWCAAGRRSTVPRSRPRASSCRRSPRPIPIITPRMAAAARR